EVLDHLLKQIEPPPTASDNYRHAREQIAKGLNWYELVSTLEQISVVVLAALERDQGDFQQFLQGINKRLVDAHGVLESSRLNQPRRRAAASARNQTVRAEVREIQCSPQQAAYIEEWKGEIPTRLDSVVGAMDQHKLSEEKRQRDLDQQLTV